MVYVDLMLISMLSVLVEACDMLCAVVAEALVPPAWDLNPDDLLSPLCRMCNLRNPSLSCIQVLALSLKSSLVVQIIVVFHKINYMLVMWPFL